MKAKKSYGQHFLTNEMIAERIADGLTLTQFCGNRVLEVGPGMGMLTKYLLKKDYELVVVEADKDMVLYLGKNYPVLNGKIIQEDFLKIAIPSIFNQQSFVLIGNFPYNISSQIIFKMLENKEFILELVGMFQKEVADRIIAPPGSKTYGIISVLLQAYYTGVLLINVSRGNFNPPPKVQSAVIRLVRKDNLQLGCDEKLFIKVVKQAFSQRRKMLRNTMKLFSANPTFLENPFLTQRPEQLSLEQFVQLTNWVQEVIGD